MVTDWGSVHIRHKNGHVEVYSITGRFLFSEDTEDSALREIGRNFIESMVS